MAKRILIADDSVTIQRAFAMTFAGADDVTVSGARSADEGLALAKNTHPDLIIADGVMPGRSGYDLCASVKAEPALRAVPVLILASTQQPYDAAKGQKAGADGQLSKPWDTNAMMEKVRELLRGGAPAAHAPAHPAHTAHTAHTAAAPAHRPAASLPTAAIEDDEYGEISIDTGRDSIPTIPRQRAATPPPVSGGRISSPSMPAVAASPPPAPPPAGGHSSPGMRPSLIPGMRPGAMPPARPGTVPARPTGPAPTLPTSAPPRPAAQPVGRTLMGVPAANIPIPGVMRPSMPSMPAVPSAPRHPTGPAAPIDARARVATPPPRQRVETPPPPPRSSLSSPAAQATISSSVEQKLAAISAKGPEYEAIAKLSREIIEQVVWEIVPELAEAIIREHVKNRV